MFNISTINDYSFSESYLPQLRDFLRISTTQEDVLIKMLFNAAINYAEQKLAITIGKKDYKLTIKGLDCINDSSMIFLPRTGLIAVLSVKINGIDAQFTMKGSYVSIENLQANDMVDVLFTCDIQPSEALMIAVFRHVFFLYENRNITNNSNSNSSFETQEIQKLYQAFFQNNFNI